MRVREEVRWKIVDAHGHKADGEQAEAQAAGDGQSLTADDSPATEDATDPQPSETAESTSDESDAEDEKTPGQIRAPGKTSRRARPGIVDVFPVNSVWKGTSKQWIEGEKATFDGDFTLTV